jgi:predicted HTH transcriptional regulator
MSPGGPPAPVTIHKIRSLNYTPCSRNPNIARALSYFERIEEQGDGIRRIVDEVRNMGLPDVKFNILDGHFTVTFTGTDKSLSRLRPIQPRVVYEVAPGKLDRLNTGQKKIMQRLLEREQVNVPQMAKLLNVTPQAVRKDMAKLQQSGLIVQKGKARATYYVLKEE